MRILRKICARQHLFSTIFVCLLTVLVVSFSLSPFSISHAEAGVTEASWVSKAPMHEARSGVGVAVVNGKIYAIGGAGKGGFRAFNEEYDPATDTWETKASMPTARLNLQANIVKGKIYLIGGIAWSNGTKVGVSNLTEVYDPVTDTWTTKASIQTAVYSYASAVVDNKIYVITSNLNQIYDAENDSWSLGASAPSPAILASAGATTGVYAPERIYVFGADADMPYWQLTLRNFTTQSYDPKTNSWTVCASMPTGRFSTGVAVVNDRLYVIGGFTLEFLPNKFTLNPSYIFSAVNEQYTPTLDIPKPVDNTKPPTENTKPSVDNTAPHIAVLSPENKTHESPDITLNFTVNESVSWIGYSLDGQETVTITGNTTIAGLKSGFHNITVYAKDEFENMGASETITFSIAKETEPFPTWIAAVIAVVGAAILVYFVKSRKQLGKSKK